MGFKVSSKLHAKLIFESIETNHVFETRKIDQGLLKIQKMLIAANYKQGDPMPPEMLEEIIYLYDQAVVLAEGYECEDEEFSPVNHVPFNHKMKVITTLMTSRFGGQEKNSPKASGE